MSSCWNITVNGTITLVGNRTKEAVNSFLPVMEAWEMHGEYGIWKCKKLSESLHAEFTASFGSHEESTYSSRNYGWYDFSDTLDCLDD